VRAITGLNEASYNGARFARRRVPALSEMKRLLSAWAMALVGASALACQVPVFRYALDHWESDRYRLEVPPAAARDEAMAATFRNLGASSPLNLDARMNAQATEARLFFPSSESVAWHGALTPETLRALTASPARTELTRRLLAGDSAVWILIEGERKAEEIAQRVERRLRLVENVAQLPKIDPNDPDSQLGPGPELLLHFSLLRVRGDDPAEAAFIRMLAGPGAETEAGFKSLPALALVFGRGRVLRAGPAESFDEAEIEDASLFLLGACSCRVKRQNPGWDLLSSVKWEEALASMAAPRRREESAAEAPETVVIKPKARP
jgi:hypothetical protein